MSPEIFTLAIFCLTVIALAVIGAGGGGNGSDGRKIAMKALNLIKAFFHAP